MSDHPCPEIETLTICVPMRLQRRGGRKLIMRQKELRRRRSHAQTRP